MSNRAGDILRLGPLFPSAERASKADYTHLIRRPTSASASSRAQLAAGPVATVDTVKGRSIASKRKGFNPGSLRLKLALLPKNVTGLNDIRQVGEVG